MAETNYNKFRKTLDEIFMLDQADLDFGIYRIMNAKRDEITRFLDTDLLPQVHDTLAELETGKRSEIETDLKKAVAAAEAVGVDPKDAPKVKELQAKYNAAVDVAAIENEVFSDLTNFFRRYYKEGDFLSLRRYKEGVYAIPYEGEEVKLHWANHDQYYIKTSETLRDYAFKLPDGRRVHFKLAAADTEKDNVKAAANEERRFVLIPTDPVTDENGELIIRFEYRPVTQVDAGTTEADAEEAGNGDEGEDAKGKKKKKVSQDKLNALALETIFKTKAVAPWLSALATAVPTAKNPKRTLLEKHLADYTARHTFDYFIHKRLGKFLRRELDFFIKNDVMHLDDIEQESAPRVEQYLTKIKAIRRIAHKIIDLLAQLEDFQKKLWLKKKFVVETNYCVTLDRIPEALYPEICQNDDQRKAWVRLFAIEEIKKDLAKPGYSEPLTVEFLKANPFLVLDTQFFETEFTNKLLASFENLDELLDGLLVHAENFQVMNLVRARYAEQITAVFIDPPYNTGVDGFPYKDRYQHSSWLSMIENRVAGIRRLLAAEALLFITIDFVEVSKLRLICDMMFGEACFLADIAWEKRYTRSNNAKRFYSLKDTVLCYRASEDLEIVREGRSEKSKKNYTNPDNDPRGRWISSSYVNPATKAERENLVYPIRNPFTGAMVEHPTHAWKYDPDTHKEHVAENRLFWGLKGEYEYPRLKSFLSKASEGMVPVDVWGYKETGTTDDGGKVLKALFGGEVFDNPKPTSLVRRTLQLNDDPSRIVLDSFAGSGTTGHATIELNREDEGQRRYILVEMGEYFDTVLKPRIQKVIYSKDWKDGKPVSREGSSHMFKYIRLESYEDALNNLELKKRAKEQEELLTESKKFREDYMLRYMLDVESRGSASLLNTARFDDPFGYQLKIATGSVGETKPVAVDLVETFNWLLGLRVKHIEVIRGFTVVQGKNPQGENVLVIWRNTKEKSNADLDTFFKKQNYNTKDQEFDLIYVNGDNNLENLRKADQSWKVRLTEDEFHKLMFDVQDV